MRVSAWLLVMLGIPLAALAQEESPPSMELLEFLGEWEEEDTGWIDRQLSGLIEVAGEAEANEESDDDE